MGHYWSEMRMDDDPEPTPLEKLEFRRIDDNRYYGQYYHVPCRQMFYFGYATTIKYAKKHAKRCKKNAQRKRT